MNFIKYLIFILIVTLFALPVAAQKNENELFQEGKQSYENNNYKHAYSIFSTLIETQCKNPEYYLARAKCLHKMVKYQDAYNDFNMAVKLGNMTSIYYFERGVFLENIPSQFTEAIDNFTMARNYADNDSMIFNSLYHRATMKNQIRDFENAGIDFRNAYKMNPKSIPLLNDMALYYNETGKSDSAIVLLQTILKIDSTETLGYQNLAFVYSGLEKYQESLEYFNKCFSLTKKTNPYLYNNRGYVKFKLKDIKGALKDINTSIKMNKNNSYAYRNRALIFIEKGKIKKACLDIEKALKLNYTQQYGDDIQNLFYKHCN